MKDRVIAVVALGLLATVCGGASPAWSLGALADAKAQKAAVKCQTLIAKTTSKALATKLKAFKACAAAALACVETKADKADCPAKAATTCTKKLGSAAAAADKAQTKITTNKSCLALGTSDLLGSDGLGFGDIAGQCAADFDLDVCDGLEPIAACVMETHEAGAGALFGRSAPRTGELLGLLPGAPFTAATGLLAQPGCGNCSAPPDARKGVEKCGKALTAGTQAVAGALESAFGKCTLGLYACTQAQAGGEKCLAKATMACTKGAAKVDKAIAKLDKVATKACGVDFAAASTASGLNLEALTGRCATLGVTPLDGPSTLASCLSAESRCAIASLVRNALPRTTEFEAAAQFGGLADDLGATCPTATLEKARTVTAPRSVFGSILKLVTSVRRTVPSALGVRAGGGRPQPRGSSGNGVSKVSGSTKFTFGSIGKFKVSYHGAKSRIGGGAPDAPPPSLIVTVSRTDIVLDDHFEIPLLDLPGDGSDVDDDLEVEFADSPPACAFELSFAVQNGDDVSGYESILQVLDNAKPVVPSIDLVSQSSAGVQQDAAADGIAVAVSANGRYVAFTSAAMNLVTPADGNGFSDVYVRDRCVADGIPVAGCAPTTTPESVDPDGQGLYVGAAGHVGISDDGRFVAYDAMERRDPNPAIVQSFVKDRCLSNGQPVDSCEVFNEDVTFDSESGSSVGSVTGLSSDGRFVVFTSTETFSSGLPRVFIFDRCVSTSDPVPSCSPFLDRVSNSIFFGEPDGDSDFGAVSRSGRFVAFRSSGSDLLQANADSNGANDVFLYDSCIDPATGSTVNGCIRGTVRVNLGPNDAESTGDDADSPALTNVAVSDDGRYVAFASTASDLLDPALDANGKRDIFVHDRCVDAVGPISGCTPATERVNLGPGDTESNGDIAGGYSLGMSAGGRLVVFTSDATNLLGPAVGTPNGTFQIFLRDRCVDKGVPLDGCTPATTLVSAAPDKGLGTGSSGPAAIAASGSTTAFQSAAPNLLGPGVDANGVTDVFARDR
jgi:WD40-like Beta Propeller Repeat